MLDELFAGLDLVLIFLISALCIFLCSFETALGYLYIRKDKLKIQSFSISCRIGVFKEDLLVFKAAYHMYQRICLPDNVQQLIALAAPLAYAGYIHELNSGVSHLLGMIQLTEFLDALIRHGYYTDVRIYRTKRIIGGFSSRPRQ